MSKTDTQWFEDSILKLDLANHEIEYFKNKKSFTPYDQIKINSILGYLRSPIDYALTGLSLIGTNKEKVFLPMFHSKKIGKDYKKFKNEIKNQIGYNDEEVVKILFSIQNEEKNWFHDLNDMNNVEKHSKISQKNVTYDEFISSIKLPGITMTNCVTIGSAQPSYIEGVNLNNYPGYQVKENLVFEYNKELVFDFLNKCVEEVNDFVLDVKEYVDQKENPSSNDQETRQVDK